MKKIICIFLFAITLTCCTTIALQNDNKESLNNENNILSKCKLIKHKERMFWEIATPTGKIFVLGTIHAGGPELLPLQKKVLDAINESERFVGEISYDDWGRINELTSSKMAKDHFDDLNESWFFQLTNSEQKQITQLIGVDNINISKYFEPWVAITLLQAAWTKKVDIKTDYGIDFEIMRILNNMNVKFEGLEDPEVQIDILSFGTREEQLYRLKSILESFNSQTSIEEERKTSYALYNAYLNNDVDEVARLINLSSSDVEKKYNDALFKNRNRQWAKRFEKYVQMSGTTFIFAGVGHFVGPNSVFEYLGLSEK